jgi:shikimate kinase
MTSLILIGMPGAGKSTMGVILAKIRGRTFIDTDLLIQEIEGRLLQEIIDTDGPASFLALEEKTICSRQFRNAVIATGGSVVLSGRAMAHLKEDGIVIYLAISFETMAERLGTATSRGIVLDAGQDLAAMYARRLPLYEQYADITIDCSSDDFKERIRNVLAALAEFPEA